MKALEKALKDHRYLIFVDLEGTQFTHEMIEIGAYSVVLNDDLTIKNINEGFSRYVKAHNSVGRVVTKLTGISEKTLQDKGVLFPKAWEEFHHYVKKYLGKATFVTFGNHDLKIINETVYFNGDAGKDLAHEFNKNYLDYSAFISTYIKDEKNNPLSLTNYLKLFGVPFEGRAHDALADAYNLIDLYKAFLEKKDLVASYYEKTLSHLSHLPAPISFALRQLSAGKDVTADSYQEAIKKALL